MEQPQKSMYEGTYPAVTLTHCYAYSNQLNVGKIPIFALKLKKNIRLRIKDQNQDFDCCSFESDRPHCA